MEVPGLPDGPPARIAGAPPSSMRVRESARWLKKVRISDRNCPKWVRPVIVTHSPRCYRTGLSKPTFPATCAWTLEQIMAEEREQMMAKDFSPESGNSLPPKRDAVKITAILSERP